MAHSTPPAPFVVFDSFFEYQDRINMMDINVRRFVRRYIQTIASQPMTPTFSWTPVENLLIGCPDYTEISSMVRQELKQLCSLAEDENSAWVENHVDSVEQALIKTTIVYVEAINFHPSRALVPDKFYIDFSRLAELLEYEAWNMLTNDMKYPNSPRPFNFHPMYFNNGIFGHIFQKSFHTIYLGSNEYHFIPKLIWNNCIWPSPWHFILALA